jgi:Bacterial PH domain
VPFRASWDRTTRIISAVVCLGLLAIVFGVHNAILTVLSVMVLFIAAAWSPQAYALNGQFILVRRKVGTVRIPLAAVREVRRADGEDLRGCIRLWGSGGLFGYYGVFSTPKLGRSTWYVTNRSNIVVLVTDAKTVLLSPDDVSGFLDAVRAAATPPSTAAGIEAGLSPAPRRASGKWIGLGIALAAAGLVTAAMLYSPGAPGYTLTSDTLAIHDRFYPVTLPASAVDLSGVRIVDLHQNTGWLPVRRTDGFANPFYESGWFQVANGDKVRLYRAGGARVVLLPPRGAGPAVLYQAADPDAFVEQLRGEWAPAARHAGAGANAGK